MHALTLAINHNHNPNPSSRAILLENAHLPPASLYTSFRYKNMTASSFPYSIVCVANGNMTEIAHVIDTKNIV